MDDIGKQASSYQLDQEILDARGINMTVEEVAGLSTCKYSERVHSLRLSEDDLAFLKGLRRRIKNRLASQNSRRRSMEHLRRLTRELRAVRACRNDALSERRGLLLASAECRRRLELLRGHVTEVLKQRCDTTQIPNIDDIKTETHKENKTTNTAKTQSFRDNVIERDKHTFECRIDKLVQQSVNHIYKEKRVCAKTVFLEKICSTESDGDDCVLNLCVKERRGHGRKQLAPKRVAYCEEDDGVLDLKIKKENL